MRSNRTSILHNSNITKNSNKDNVSDTVNKQKNKRKQKLSDLRNSLNEEELKRVQEELFSQGDKIHKNEEI